MGKHITQSRLNRRNHMWSRGPKVPKVRRLRFNLRRSIMRHHQRHNL
ncbi:hypothetical protein GCM10009615_03050 [Corynebacterium durum]